MLYIDALRGVTMFLVVYHHVLGKCFKDDVFVDVVIQSFRMPVFFFVSGFVAYKALEFWNRQNTCDRLIKKVRSQVVPTLIFYCAYYYFMRDSRPLLLLYQYGWRQYWFTIVLFEFFVIYFIVNYLTRKNKTLNVLTLITIVIASIITFHTVEYNNKFYLLTEAHRIQYLPFFILGTFTRRHYDHILRFFDNKLIVVAIVALFLLQVPALNDILVVPAKIKNFVEIWSIRITGLAMVFGLFAHFRDHFTTSSHVTKCLTYVGRRTLDIYLMHFFFITHIPHIHLWIRQRVPASVDHLIIVAIAVIVVLVCVLTSALIRKNKFLGRLLFAAKQ